MELPSVQPSGIGEVSASKVCPTLLLRGVMATVRFITHCEVVIDPAMPAPDWPLLPLACKGYSWRPGSVGLQRRAEGEGGRAQRLIGAGVQVVVPLALSDEGAPSYDRALAARLATLGVPAFACTPDLFPDMMAAAFRKADLNVWATSASITAVPASAVD